MFGPAGGPDPPPVRGGCFVPHDDARGAGEWADDWRGYQDAHAGEVFVAPPWLNVLWERPDAVLADAGRIHPRWPATPLPAALRLPSERADG